MTEVQGVPASPCALGGSDPDVSRLPRGTVLQPPSVGLYEAVLAHLASSLLVLLARFPPGCLWEHFPSKSHSQERALSLWGTEGRPCIRNECDVLKGR